MITFDARPLTEPVDEAEVARADRAYKASSPRSGAGIAAIVILAVVVVVFLGVGSLFAVVGVAVASQGGEQLPWTAAVLPSILVVVAIGAVILAVVSARRSRERRYRLARFAAANGMQYLPALASPQLPGMVFGRGSSRQAHDLVRGTRPRFVEFANYQYTTGSGKNRTTHRWGYIAVHLDTPLPHIVLDALGNNGLGLSNLPITLARGQRLSLEGDFDSHFALYCPEGYEQDALYLFTPDIMARFIDSAGELDVEIVDDWLFLYTRRQVSTTDPANWEWLFSVVGALMDKLDQWGRWRDDHLAAQAASPLGSPVAGDPTGAFAAPAALITPPKGVAAPGRRLKGGFSWSFAVVLAVVILWQFGAPLLQALIGSR
ncbi:hypothetical protein ACOKGD_01035 [Microbacterium phosphatis]|uniref:hypothetical protein n=1 Tax=Microbacterium phosphatis TaxID=3140248 RepID=UPI00313FF9AC